MSAFDRIPRQKTIAVIGLGNDMLSDDGAGIRVVRELKGRPGLDNIKFEELSVGGLPLLDSIIDHEECIIVDAIMTGDHPPGTTLRFLQTPGSEPATLTSSHQIDLAQVLTLATLLGAKVPRKLTVYGIEARDVTTFHEGCTEEVAGAIPKLAEAIYRDLKGDEHAPVTHPGAWHIITDAVPE